jgi:hypothetical protein
MSIFEAQVTLNIIIEAKDKSTAKYALENIEIEPKLPRYTEAKIIDSEEVWGEIEET